MKKILALLTIAIFVTVQPANAFDFSNIFGFLNSAKNQTKVTAADCTKMISDIQTQATTLDNSMQTSFLDIVSKLSTSKETNTVKANLDKIFSQTTETAAEKRADMASLMADYIAALASNKDSSVAKIQSLTDTQKSELINDVFEMQECAKKYIEMAKKSISTVSAVKKATTTASEAAQMIAEVNNTVGNVKTAANTMVSIQSQLKSLAKLAGLSM